MITFLSSYILKNPLLMLKLSSFEDKILKKKIQNYKIKSPIYITGLARSGTTILLEFLSKHKGFATHSYSNFPFIYTPYLCNSIFNVLKKDSKTKERSHLDGIMINNQSPESFEEIIWNQFFPNLHDIKKSSNLYENNKNQEFETFYTNHVKKLILSKKAFRYLSKANYNINRLPYLKSIFNDLRVIIMVRNPIDFIASSIKQDILFCREQKKDIKKLHHTNTTQHFEFGLNKIPINFGNNNLTEEIAKKFESNNKIEAWSKYWNEACNFIINLQESKFLKDNIKIVLFEDLCNNTEKELLKILNFCDIKHEDNLIKLFKDKIKLPSYYEHNFSSKELELITSITKKTQNKFYN